METNDFYRGMIQAILAETPHETDPIAREDNVFYRLGELAMGDDPVITDREAMECWEQYIQSTRPDAKVIHIGEVVSERARFYE